MRICERLYDGRFTDQLLCASLVSTDSLSWKPIGYVRVVDGQFMIVVTLFEMQLLLVLPQQLLLNPSSLQVDLLLAAATVAF
jgi:hypothetical protein